MKRIFSLSLLFILFTSSVFAQGPRAVMLRVRLSDNTPISVYLDGRYINKQTTSLTLDGIRPGTHRLEVFSEINRRRPVRIYTGTIRLQPGIFYSGVVDVYNRGLRLRSRPIDDREDYQGRPYNDNDRDYDRDCRDSNPRNNGNDNSYDDRQLNDKGSGNDEIYNDNQGSSEQGEGDGWFPRGRGNTSLSGPDASVFSQRDMNDLKGRVSARITDSDKEQLLKTALDGRSISTEQVRQMLRWLSFESTRLDFAKWAYTSVSDRQNYWKLEDSFDFSSSKKGIYGRNKRLSKSPSTLE